MYFSVTEVAVAVLMLVVSIGACIVLLVVSIGACVVPARRASALDPARMLRD